jgi:DNA-binding transcriptional ArsR family regulator
VNVTAPVGRSDLLEESLWVVVEDHFLRGAVRALRAQHEDVEIRPRPPGRPKGGLKRDATHERRVARPLELREAVVRDMLGDVVLVALRVSDAEGRISQLDGPAFRRRHVPVEADAETGPDVHLQAPSSEGANHLRDSLSVWYRSSVAATTLDKSFQALADPTRRAIVARLSAGPASVSELAAPLDMSLPAVAQHLDVLHDCGLVRSKKVGRVRTCRLSPEPLRSVEQWIAQHRTAWETRLDRLGEVLEDTYRGGAE